MKIKKVDINQVQINNENFYKITNSDAMRPFFMSIVSNSNHWMFVSSNGGISAGRKNSEQSLFPYYTDDKITESAEITGSKTIIKVIRSGKNELWEPFSHRNEGVYNVVRNLYKNTYGNKVVFEEINKDLELIFRYSWCSSNDFGFVKKSTLINTAAHDQDISIIDGIQNILPFGVGSDTQNQVSNLVDAYKRSELHKDSGLGIYALSSIIADKAEPSEALKANIVWSIGLRNINHLVSSLQLNDFRINVPIHAEYDIKGEKGAYFIQAELSLPSKSEEEWMIVANVNQSQSEVIQLIETITNDNALAERISEDIEEGTKRLIALNASSDGLQRTADNLRDTRHFSNTLFNIMRGGIFDDNYVVEKWDFVKMLKASNKDCFDIVTNEVLSLPEKFSINDLYQLAFRSKNEDFIRLSFEYLPLKFSRRHGDPSRPWNKFSINTINEIDGSKVLDYEGNWRDIFQNWEALAISYPGYLESIIHKFLNATTFDGYNAYRVTKAGFDWEIIEPDDPWSYIGYWGDHQIIYLLKFLEMLENHDPGKLEHYFNKDLFVYANVPYKIKSYKDILENPKDTIIFDHESDEKIRELRSKIGADGALLQDRKNNIYKVNFIEKTLATILAKISNFIPEAGIWMNTQRPEWNDANNALVGNGVSMVTLCYLRRFLTFFDEIIESSDLIKVAVSVETLKFFTGVHDTLADNVELLSSTINDKSRKQILDGLGQAGSDFRLKIYNHGFSGDKQSLEISSIKTFIKLSLQYLEHSIDANKRQDNLYHAYNLMTVENEEEVSISHLNEMLEGQVAILSSGYLSASESLQVLDSLKASKLFREDQYSYLLYPNVDLPKFLQKNNIPNELVSNSELLTELLSKGNRQIIERDVNGTHHFNGNFKNANDLKLALATFTKNEYKTLSENSKKQVLHIFEEVFNHKAFTGRSGTFFGYEGLGSIYWHMVSKLLLAVQESCLKAAETGENEEIIGRLLEHYYEINAGIGVHKSPSLYGAFPTDPYSHTPAGKGAQQPGMTGQVKEDILSRFGELGVNVKEGRIHFEPSLLKKEEFLLKSEPFYYYAVNQEYRQLNLEKGSLCFTYCQVPIIYKLGDESTLSIAFEDNTNKSLTSVILNKEISKKIFNRTGEIKQITVFIMSNSLK